MRYAILCYIVLNTTFDGRVVRFCRSAVRDNAKVNIIYSQKNIQNFLYKRLTNKKEHAIIRYRKF